MTFMTQNDVLCADVQQEQGDQLSEEFNSYQCKIRKLTKRRGNVKEVLVCVTWVTAMSGRVS